MSFRSPFFAHSRHARLLQDVPSRDLAPAFLASLPNTAAVLAALRKAHAGRQAILGGKPPLKQQIVRLSALSAYASVPGVKTLSCHRAAFSADGQFLAISIIALVSSSTPWVAASGPDQRSTSEQSSGSERDMQPVHWTPRCGVAVLKVAEGFAERAFVSTGTSPILRWAPEAPYLSIAHDPGKQSRGQQPAVLVLDARTGAVVRALGPESESAFREACLYGCWSFFNLEWSASGRLLLVTGYGAEERDEEGLIGNWIGRGQVSVFDVWQHSSLVAQSDMEMSSLSSQTHRGGSSHLIAATWHPSSLGLVVSHGVELQAPQAFTQAGLALGVLAEPCVLLHSPHGTVFSPDGKLLIACVGRDGHDMGVEGSEGLEEGVWETSSGSKLGSDSFSDPGSMSGDEEEEDNGPYDDPESLCSHRIMQCQLEGRHMLFHRAQVATVKGRNSFWLPCSSRLVVGGDSGGSDQQQAQICSVRDRQDMTAIPGSPLRAPICFSPSQNMMAVSAIQPRIISLQSGKTLWAADAGISRCLAFLPCGSGVLCVGTADNQPRGHAELRIYIFA